MRVTEHFPLRGRVENEQRKLVVVVAIRSQLLNVLNLSMKASALIVFVLSLRPAKLPHRLELCPLTRLRPKGVQALTTLASYPKAKMRAFETS